VQAKTPSLSFEFFPPRDISAMTALKQQIDVLAQVEPDFWSITYGAGGLAKQRHQRSVELTELLAGNYRPAVLAHLTCVGHTTSQLRAIAKDLRNAGAVAALALRGDPPGGLAQPWQSTPGGLDHATDLVKLLVSSGLWPSVGVAAFPYGHPEARSLSFDTKVMYAKQAAGASLAITQMVFDAAAWQRLVQRLRLAEVNLPVVPGIMPISSPGQIAKLEQFSGAELPELLRQQLADAGSDPAAVERVGVAWAKRSAQTLLEMGAPGIHLYTLNRSSACLAVARALASLRS
jgi:methylenetetrahydrofolate reductase (NADPH)